MKSFMTKIIEIVILANGQFPVAEQSLDVLDRAGRLICCDEAADKALEHGREPDIIIGDLDSVSEDTKKKFPGKLVHIEEQDTNDLTKAVNYCIEKGYRAVSILGATGLREDHSLGNISLLLEYNKGISVNMITDHGEFSCLGSGEELSSFPGEKISFFSVDNSVRVSSRGLKYKLDNMRLHNWWRATLNEVEGDSFSLEFESEFPLILFRTRN